MTGALSSVSENRMRSSKNRKSICGGQCWYCGTPPQINECVGNTALVLKGQHSIKDQGMYTSDQGHLGSFCHHYDFKRSNNCLIINGFTLTTNNEGRYISASSLIISEKWPKKITNSARVCNLWAHLYTHYHTLQQPCTTPAIFTGVIGKGQKSKKI